MKKRRSAAAWERLVDEWRSGDESMTAFARARGLALSSFHRWTQRFPDPEEFTDVGFCEVIEVEGGRNAPTVGKSIVLRVGSVSVELPDWPPAEYLALVARAYEAVSPC